MANLSIRKLDDKTLGQLRLRATSHHVSMEEEVRQILRQSVLSPRRLGDVALRIFGINYGVTLNLPKHKPHEPLDLPK